MPKCHENWSRKLNENAHARRQGLMQNCPCNGQPSKKKMVRTENQIKQVMSPVENKKIRRILSRGLDSRKSTNSKTS